MLDLNDGSSLLRLLCEPVRLRLLMLLQAERLSVAELTEITELSQSRVSTHLARLRQAGLVRDERVGSASYHSVASDDIPGPVRQLWGALADNLEDDQLQRDRERAAEIVRRRGTQASWAESVAGRMERHYSPGRTWEATAHALIGLLRLGDVLDIASGDGVLSELVAPRSATVTCLDISETLLEAARRRLGHRDDVFFRHADMHALPFPGDSFDQVFLMHALTYTRQPAAAIREAARVMRAGGTLVASTLKRHGHHATVTAFDHVNLGFSADELRGFAESADLSVEMCELTSREARPPYFEVLTLVAHRRA